MSVRVPVRLVFADRGSFHDVVVHLPADALQRHERVVDDRVATVLLQDVIFAASSRVNGTPAFLVNNRNMVMGLKSFEEWRDILDKELKKAR